MEKLCVFSYQNKILRILAMSKLRHTKVENPSAFLVLLMSLYCGMNGNTPPKIIAPADAILMTLVNVRSGMVICERMEEGASTADWIMWATGSWMSTISDWWNRYGFKATSPEENQNTIY